MDPFKMTDVDIILKQAFLITACKTIIPFFFKSVSSLSLHIFNDYFFNN